MEKDLQTITLKEYDPQLWTCVHCHCGLCVANCPVYDQIKNEAIGMRGLAHIGVAVLEDELKLLDMSDELIYACTGCRYCETICSLNTPVFIQEHGTRRTKVSGATLTEIFKAMKVEAGEVPEIIRTTLDNVGRVGNPYGKPKADKDEWVKGLGLQFTGGAPLLYVGSLVPYEDRSTKCAEALIEVFKKAGFKFSMMGSDESDSGALARYLGEEGLFGHLVEQQLELFKAKGIKEIICLSPHDYDVFITCCDGIKVKHYTEVLSELVKKGKITLNKKVNKKVAYQDPCYLGRQHNIYEPPRDILKSIPGLELVEMDRNQKLGYCCGGGGTGLWYELPRFKINNTRVDHAKEKGINYLAVACPVCLQMLDDGVKFKNYDIEVKGIAQIVLESL